MSDHIIFTRSVKPAILYKMELFCIPKYMITKLHGHIQMNHKRQIFSLKFADLSNANIVLKIVQQNRYISIAKDFNLLV